jgi:aminoglycoside/choline kinase family phosphotransferase
MDADGVDIEPALRRLYGAELPRGRLQKLKGDASTRSYYRFELEGSPPAGLPRSSIVMRLPEDALKSDEGQGKERPSELPFLDVQRMLAARGIPVPRVYVDDTAGRVLLLEDLGDETFADRLQRTPRGEWLAPYGDAVDLLARLHRACAAGDPGESVAFRRSFDRQLLRWEFDHFLEWGLLALIGPLRDTEQTLLDRSFDALCSQITALPQGFVHRDYQSRNLMWAGGSALTVIDFQDALLGPAVYDLCALLCDSYVALEQHEQERLVHRYATATKTDADRLQQAFWTVAVQRKLKDAGRFVFIDRVRGNPDFLQWYPQSIRYAARAMRELGLNELFELLAQRLPGFPDQLSPPPALSKRPA